jgi:C1A family cysteine protease
MPEQYQTKRFGRLPSPRSFKDFTPETPTITRLLGSEPRATSATSIDLRPNCSPIRNQLDIGSCVAFACCGLVEYYQKKSKKAYLQMSPLYVYKMARHMLKWTGDTGLFIKSGMSALAHFGAPKEADWPYDTSEYETMPTWDVGAIAANYQALKYFRLDAYPYTKPESILTRIKSYIAAGNPSVFGFSCFESIFDDNTGDIAFPSQNENVIGGHAVLAVGYDDNLQIRGSSTRGAFLIRNSWGTGWGRNGYGFLPYQYVLQGLADEFWIMTSAEFLDAAKTE